MTSIKFKHFRNHFGRLFMTTCEIEIVDDKHEGEATGVAICSERDQFSRKIGRDLALFRAKKAILSGRNTLPIKPRDVSVIREALNEVAAFKSMYYPHLEGNP
jgi:hypothetical protein